MAGLGTIFLTALVLVVLYLVVGYLTRGAEPVRRSTGMMIFGLALGCYLVLVAFMVAPGVPLPSTWR